MELSTLNRQELLASPAGRVGLLANTIRAPSRQSGLPKCGARWRIFSPRTGSPDTWLIGPSTARVGFHRLFPSESP